jgi:hypothetical protein
MFRIQNPLKTDYNVIVIEIKINKFIFNLTFNLVYFDCALKDTKIQPG